MLPLLIPIGLLVGAVALFSEAPTEKNVPKEPDDVDILKKEDTVSDKSDKGANPVPDSTPKPSE